jgi:hypothetical protein
MQDHFPASRTSEEPVLTSCTRCELMGPRTPGPGHGALPWPMGSDLAAFALQFCRPVVPCELHWYGVYMHLWLCRVRD